MDAASVPADSAAVAVPRGGLSRGALAGSMWVPGVLWVDPYSPAQQCQMSGSRPVKFY